MSRILTPATEAASLAGLCSPVFLADIDTLGGHVRIWTGIGNLVFAGDTYVGGGQHCGVDQIKETVDLEASGMTFRLNGLDPALLAACLSQIQQGRLAKLWLGFLDSSLALIADPVLLFEGFTDVPEMEDSGDTASISLSTESRLIDLDRPRSRRYTDQDQKINAPGDRGFEYVPSLQDRQIVFGR